MSAQRSQNEIGDEISRYGSFVYKDDDILVTNEWVVRTTNHSDSHSSNFREYVYIFVGALAIFSAVYVFGEIAPRFKIPNQTELQEGTSSSKPNFIFILADDLGWNSIGYNDYDLAFTTPTLTSLAQMGVTMSNYYALEVCTPSRAALLTGRYPLSIGMQFGEVDPAVGWGLNLSETILPQILQNDGGYTTYMIGKWHLGHHSPRYLPTARGFDYFLGYMAGQSYHWSKREPNFVRFHDLLYGSKDCYAGYNGSDLHTYSTFFYADKAVDIISNHNYGDSPMFLYLSMQAVHDPFFDVRKYTSGIPVEYMDTTMYSAIMDTVKPPHATSVLKQP